MSKYLDKCMQAIPKKIKTKSADVLIVELTGFVGGFKLLVSI